MVNTGMTFSCTIVKIAYGSFLMVLCSTGLKPLDRVEFCSPSMNPKASLKVLCSLKSRACNDSNEILKWLISITTRRQLEIPRWCLTEP